MQPDAEARTLDLARMLVGRLERISADSLWARRASGARAALLKLLDELENPGLAQSETSAQRAARLEHLRWLMQWSFGLLEKAARELTR